MDVDSPASPSGERPRDRGGDPPRSAADPSHGDRRLDMLPLGGVPETPGISPRMTALFGGLFGLATVASIFALLIQVFPVQDDRARAAASVPSPSASAAAPSAPAKKHQRTRVKLPGPWRLSKLEGSHRIVRGEMQRRSFIVALAEAGVPKAEIYRILKAMDGVYSFDRPGKRHGYAVAMQRPSRKVEAFEYTVSPTEIYQARTGKEGLLVGARLDLKVRSEEVAASFYVGKSFTDSYRRAGLEDGLARVVNKAFNGQTSVEAFEEGGTVRLILVEQTALGDFVRYERVKALEYRPPDPKQPPLRAYWFEGESVRGYVDDKGRRPSNKGWRTPIPGAPITSHFNPKRLHPVLKKVMPHNGTDFGAPSGTPVYAAYRGKVALVGMHGASGNLVLVDHPGAIQTGYAHLSRFAKGLKIGQAIGTRQLVGYVGSTGRSTGPHLHFSAKRDGKFFDATTLRMDALHVLPPDERAAFMSQKALLDKSLEAIPLPDPPDPEPEPAADDQGGSDAVGGQGEPDESSDTDSGRSDEGKSDGDDGKGKTDAKEKAGGKGKADEDAGGETNLLGEDLSGDIE